MFLTSDCRFYAIIELLWLLWAVLFLLNPGYFHSKLHLAVLDNVDHNFAIIWPIWVVLKLFCDFAPLDLYGQSFMEFCDTVPNFHYLLFTIPWTLCVLQSPVIVT